MRGTVSDLEPWWMRPWVFMPVCLFIMFTMITLYALDRKAENRSARECVSKGGTWLATSRGHYICGRIETIPVSPP